MRQQPESADARACSGEAPGARPQRADRSLLNGFLILLGLAVIGFAIYSRGPLIAASEPLLLQRRARHEVRPEPGPSAIGALPAGRPVRSPARLQRTAGVPQASGREGLRNRCAGSRNPPARRSDRGRLCAALSREVASRAASAGLSRRTLFSFAYPERAYRISRRFPRRSHRHCSLSRTGSCWTIRSPPATRRSSGHGSGAPSALSS